HTTPVSTHIGPARLSGRSMLEQRPQGGFVFQSGHRGRTPGSYGPRKRCLPGAVRNERARTPATVATTFLRSAGADLARDRGVGQRNPLPNLDTRERTCLHRIPAAVGVSIASTLACERLRLARPVRWCCR